MVFLRCIGTLLRHARFLLHWFCDCGLIIAQTGVGCFGIRFCLGERRIKKCLKTGALKFGCGKSGTEVVENTWKTVRIARSFPRVFLMCSMLVPMDEEKARKSFWSLWETMWKMLQNHVFSRHTASFDSSKTGQTGKHYIFKINI